MGSLDAIAPWRTLPFGSTSWPHRSYTRCTYSCRQPCRQPASPRPSPRPPGSCRPPPRSTCRIAKCSRLPSPAPPVEISARALSPQATQAAVGLTPSKGVPRRLTLLHSLKQSSWQLTANAGITGCDEARRAAHATAEACCREMSSRVGGRRSALLVSTRSSSRREIAHIATCEVAPAQREGRTTRDHAGFW